MIRILFAATLLLLSAASVTLAAETTTTFVVENMTCALCPLTVRKAIEGVDGVLEVDVDLDAKTATVRYDDARATKEAIARASRDAGYPARPDPS